MRSIVRRDVVPTSNVSRPFVRRIGSPRIASDDVFGSRFVGKGMTLPSFLKACLAGMLGAVLGAASMMFVIGGHGAAALGPSIAVAAGEDDQQLIVDAVKHV